MLPLDFNRAKEQLINMAGTRWEVTIYANKSDSETRSGYVRVVYGDSPVAVLAEALHAFATDTGLPRNAIFRFEGEVIPEKSQ